MEIYRILPPLLPRNPLRKPRLRRLARLHARRVHRRTGFHHPPISNATVIFPRGGDHRCRYDHPFRFHLSTCPLVSQCFPAILPIHPRSVPRTPRFICLSGELAVRARPEGIYNTVPYLLSPPPLLPAVLVDCCSITT